MDQVWKAYVQLLNRFSEAGNLPQVGVIVYMATGRHVLHNTEKKKFMQHFSTLEQKLNIHNPSSVGISELLSDILSSIENSSEARDFEAVRLNWYRVSAAINSQQSPVPPATAAPLNTAMTNVLVHTRFVDRVDQLIKQHASLMLLFWYRATLLEVRHCLCVNGIDCAV